MCIRIPGSRGIKPQCAGELLVMYCEGLFPRRARGTLSSKSREDKGRERPDGSGLWFSQEVKNFVQSRNKLDKSQSSCFLQSANGSRGSYGLDAWLEDIIVSISVSRYSPQCCLDYCVTFTRIWAMWTQMTLEKVSPSAYVECPGAQSGSCS